MKKLDRYWLREGIEEAPSWLLAAMNDPDLATKHHPPPLVQRAVKGLSPTKNSASPVRGTGVEE